MAPLAAALPGAQEGRRGQPQDSARRIEGQRSCAAQGLGLRAWGIGDLADGDAGHWLVCVLGVGSTTESFVVSELGTALLALIV